MRVLRVYHGGRSPAHRARERALVAAGIDVVLVVPANWPDDGSESELAAEGFRIAELTTARRGNVNRHAYRNPAVLRELLRDVRPDVLDVHEEPFSIASRQWLAAAPLDLSVVMYTAQNVDKRFPPPFAQYERAAHRRVGALYPCSAQAASVARGKGFAGHIEVLPLGYDDAVFTPGMQSLDDDDLALGLFGRLVPEKGVADAVQILAKMHEVRPTRLLVVGRGPEETTARALASELGVADRLELVPWQSTSDLAARYRTVQVVLVPSRPTLTWVEQFGRVVVEAQASGAVVAGYASGSIREVSGDVAILAEVGAVSQLAQRLIDLAADPVDFARRREQGIALSRTRTWRRVAERQAELYRRVVAGDVQHLLLAPSPRRRRAAARAEFGPTAVTAAGERPFALPLLRRGGTSSSVLGSTLDSVAELKARAQERLHTSR